jgi:hypothetical protein
LPGNSVIVDCGANGAGLLPFKLVDQGDCLNHGQDLRKDPAGFELPRVQTIGQTIGERDHYVMRHQHALGRVVLADERVFFAEAGAAEKGSGPAKNSFRLVLAFIGEEGQAPVQVLVKDFVWLQRGGLNERDWAFLMDVSFGRQFRQIPGRLHFPQSFGVVNAGPVSSLRTFAGENH